MRSNRHLDPVLQYAFMLVAERLQLMFSDEVEFRRLVEAGLRFKSSVVYVDEKVEQLEYNFFSEEMLEALICGGSSYNPDPVSYIWDRLRDREIVVEALGAKVDVTRAWLDHVLDRRLLKGYLMADTLLNIFAPPSALLERYRHAVVSIDVRTELGSPRGTGLIVDTDEGATLVTCRHNVDRADGVVGVNAITTSAGDRVTCSEFRLHPTADVAAMGVEAASIGGPLLRLSSDVTVFDEVYTLGYPAIPQVSNPGIVAHRGEVNGRVTTYVAGGHDLLLISNLISPGNSGGPLLDRDGFCVGMSTQWLEGKYDNEQARFSAAVPADVIAAWLSDGRREAGDAAH